MLGLAKPDGICHLVGVVQAEESLTGRYFNFEHHFVTSRQLLSDAWGYGSSKAGEEDSMMHRVSKATIDFILMVRLPYSAAEIQHC